MIKTNCRTRLSGIDSGRSDELKVRRIWFYDERVMSELADRDCIPCKGGVPPLKGEALADLEKRLGNGWEVINQHHLEKAFTFKNFREALAFTNRVGELAELQRHHPDIYLAWGRVQITVWTHKIDGLTESDFILAAKIDPLMNCP
jgi:4a-hydroxytetrahydrobiopterin dehydratase